MEWSILFVGPVGAGKTQAIRTISDIEVASTEEAATDQTASTKASTTVAMDVGAMHLDSQDKLRLMGAPGQDRFDFMWDILLRQAKGVVILIDHSRASSLADLQHYLHQMRTRMADRPLPIVIGVTHVDTAPSGRMLDIYRAAWLRACSCNECKPPILEVDARNRDDVRVLLLALTSLLEMSARVPGRAAH